jgi:hypothetical protein
VSLETVRARTSITRRFGQFDALPSYRVSLGREGLSSLAELAIVGDRNEVVDGIDKFRQAAVTEFLWNDASTTPYEKAANLTLLPEIVAAPS